MRRATSVAAAKCSGITPHAGVGAAILTGEGATKAAPTGGANLTGPLIQFQISPSSTGAVPFGQGALRGQDAKLSPRAARRGPLLPNLLSSTPLGPDRTDQIANSASGSGPRRDSNRRSIRAACASWTPNRRGARGLSSPAVTKKPSRPSVRQSPGPSFRPPSVTLSVHRSVTHYPPFRPSLARMQCNHADVAGNTHAFTPRLPIP